MVELQGELAIMRQKLGIYISPSPMSSPVSFRAMMGSDFLQNCSSFSTLDTTHQTPELLKKSGIWSTLKLADKKDAHARGELNKPSNHMLSYFGSNFSLSPHQKTHRSSFPDSTHSSSRSKQSLDSRSDHYSSPSRTSTMLSGFVSLITGIHEEDDDFASETPPQTMKPKVRRSMMLNERSASIRDLIHQNSEEDDNDPTSLALKILSDEVFSF
jgi:hypothetical protein